MRTVRLFVSSPGDVDFERQRVERVAERLNGEFAQVARFETVRWETKFYKAHDNFQAQIPEAADCDIVIAIFWSRLGTELADSFPRMPDGSRYASGSAYEVLTAIEARKTADRPDVYVFRKTERPTSPIDMDAELSEARLQWNRLEEFFRRHFHTPDGHFVGAYHTCRTTDDFEAQVETLLTDWIHEHFIERLIVWPIELKGSPFRGLAAFDAKHASIFFGRTRKVMRAVEHLKDAARKSFDAPDRSEAPASERRLKPFLLIVGPSGAGKSSLMRAGLAPRLTTPGVVPEVDLWRIAVMRPGDGAGPFEALARALLVTGGDDDVGGFGCALPELCGDDEATPETLADLLRLEPAAAAAQVVAQLDRVAEAERVHGGFERAVRADLLLLVDQLEDVFAASITEAQRTAFAHLLAVLSATQRVWVVATLRGDLYNRLIKNRAFIALKDAGTTYDLAPPGADELGEIIQKSAEAAGLVYEADPVTGERLDDRLLKDAEGKDILPLLQFTLNRLFEEREVVDGETRLTLASYKAMGGLDGAIDQSAERVLERLSEAEIATLPRLLRSLAVPVKEDAGAAAGAAELTVHAVPVEEVVSDDATRRMVEALVEARIVLASQSDGGGHEEGDEEAGRTDGARPEASSAGLLRIAHQRVFECWERARKIIVDNRDFYRIRNAVESQRRLWQTGGRTADLLIPDGRSLEEAESLIGRYGDELPAETRNFVAQSTGRARRNRKIKRAMQVALGVVAIVATGASVVATHFERQAVQNEQRAQANYESARDTVDQLVTRIAEGLRDLDRISVRTVDEALKTVSALVDNLEAASGGDPLLKRTRAAMRYEFARTFQAAEDRGRAFKEASDGLAIREQLVKVRPAELEWHWDLALSLDQVGDLHRAINEIDPARGRFDQALAIRRKLYRDQPAVPKWGHGISLSLVRIGDIKFRPGNDIDGARTAYDEALAVSTEVFRREPGNVRWQRELSWTFNKVGDIRLHVKNHSAALDAFEKGLCIRRYMSNRDDKNTLWVRDVAYSLERVSDVRIGERDFPSAELAAFESLGIRNRLVDSDPTQSLWLRELATTLNRIGDIKLGMNEPPLAAGFYLEAVDRSDAVLRRIPESVPARRQRDLAEGGLAKAAQALGRSAADLRQDRSLRARRGEEELKFERQLLARQYDPLSCWNHLVVTLGDSAAAPLPKDAM